MVQKKTKGKAAKKAAPKRAAKKAGGSKKPAGFNGAKKRAAKKGKPRRTSPVQQELIKGVRYADLDRLCRAIGDNRDEINQFKGEGKSLETSALKAMRVHGVTHYKGAGVLLSIIPGDEKLLVKKDRSGGSDGGQVDPPAEGETGEGQDPAAIGEALTEGEDGEGDVD